MGAATHIFRERYDSATVETTRRSDVVPRAQTIDVVRAQTMLPPRPRPAVSRFRVKLRGGVYQGRVRVVVFLLVAKDVDDAVRIALALEAPRTFATMALDECDLVEEASGALRGVEAVLARFEIPA